MRKRSLLRKVINPISLEFAAAKDYSKDNKPP